ncbi:HAD family hydrolase [Candidatus Nanosalina sp. VS9-1]|uniref:HAD family hydrolase n=1 Tax=Candidatus Nanosalina sp. VS9-1 TaxID=3388566 RepID=UPI0039DF55AB
MKYDAVIFDFDGVLIDSGFDGFEWALKERKKLAEVNGWDIDFETVGQGVFQPQDVELEKILEKEGLSWEQLKLLEKAVAERKVEMASTGELEIFNDAEIILEGLDCQMAIVSNAYNDYLAGIMEGLEIKDYMDFWIAPRIENIRSYRERMKPEPEMVEEALEELGTRNAIMIGDQIEDIMAARKAGIDSIYIDRNGDTEEKADHSVESLKQALEIIRS